MARLNDEKTAARGWLHSTRTICENVDQKSLPQTLYVTKSRYASVLPPQQRCDEPSFLALGHRKRVCMMSHGS
ncbi:hypothetical protein JOE11_001804 [Robbsia andropogonis]